MNEEPETEAAPTDDLALAAAVLLKMAEDIPTPNPNIEPEATYYALFGRRAVTLFLNYQHSRSSPVELGRIIAIRPLIELTILTKWVSLNPLVHGELWMSDSESNELTQIRYTTEHLKVRGNPVPETHHEGIALKQALKDRAKATLKGMNKDYGTHLIPTVARMVEEIEKVDPGHKIAVRDTYDLGYRTFSPWEHTAASSYKGTAERGPDGKFHYIGDLSPFHAEDLDAIAISMLAYILEMVLTGAKTGDPQFARFVRDFVTQHWVPSRNRVIEEGSEPSGEEIEP